MLQLHRAPIKRTPKLLNFKMQPGKAPIGKFSQHGLDHSALTTELRDELEFSVCPLFGSSHEDFGAITLRSLLSSSIALKRSK